MSRGIIRREKAASEGLATVRYKRCGLRFELLIHRDRIPSTGGKDLSSIYSKLTDEEILELCSAQVVFSNAHKKTPSKESERAKAFESKSENFTEMARVILSQGELQKGQEDREEISKLEHASWEVFCRTVSSRSIFPPSTNKHDKTKNSSEQNRSCHLDPSEVASSLKQLRFLRTDPNAVLDSDVIRAISILRSSGEHPRLTRSMLRIQCCGGTSIMDALASIVAKHENYAITEPEGNESSADRSSQTTSSTWLILDASKQRSIAENLCSAHIFESVKDAEKKMMPHYPETNGIAADLTLINQSNVPVAKATESLLEDHGNNPAQRTKSKKKGTLSGNEKETKGDETWSHESKKKVNSLESELANLNLKFETVEAEDDDMTQTDRGRKKKGQKK